MTTKKKKIKKINFMAKKGVVGGDIMDIFGNYGRNKKKRRQSLDKIEFIAWKKKQNKSRLCL